MGSQFSQHPVLKVWNALLRLPLDVIKEIAARLRRAVRDYLLTAPFTNDTLHRAVQDYLAGGYRKKQIVATYGDISHWDVSSVTDMSRMFEEASSFNQPLKNWDVSNVTNMAGMFSGASSFNQPLNNWGVSNVTNMSYMFH